MLSIRQVGETRPFVHFSESDEFEGMDHAQPREEDFTQVDTSSRPDNSITSPLTSDVSSTSVASSGSFPSTSDGKSQLDDKSQLDPAVRVHVINSRALDNGDGKEVQTSRSPVQLIGQIKEQMGRLFEDVAPAVSSAMEVEQNAKSLLLAVQTLRSLLRSQNTVFHSLISDYLSLLPKHSEQNIELSRLRLENEDLRKRLREQDETQDRYAKRRRTR